MAHLRPGSAGSSTAADHIVAQAALAQLPEANPRPGKKVLIRADGAGGTRLHQVAHAAPGRLLRRVHPPTGHHQPLQAGPRGCGPRPSTTTTTPVKALTWPVHGLLNLDGWPRHARDRARDGPARAQLRFDDVDGYQLTAFATTPAPASCRTSNCGTGAGPAAKTGSESPNTGLNNCLARLRPEPDLAQIVALASRLRAGRDARPRRPKPAAGNETAALPTVHDPSHHRPPGTPDDPPPV